MKLKKLGAAKSIALTAMLLIWSATGVSAAETLVLTTLFNPPITTFVERLLNEALRPYGIEVEVDRIPGQRALMNANDGITDGDALRTGKIEPLVPNLIRVPEDILSLTRSAFTRGLEFQVTGWDSLKPYHVGIIRGAKGLEKNVVDTKSLIRAKNAELLFKLLQSDRIEVAVWVTLDGLAWIKKLNIAGVEVLEPPFYETDMFVYLHKRHEDLVPKLVSSFRAMKADGRYQEIYDEAFSHILN